jgi:hypothetical protein
MDVVGERNGRRTGVVKPAILRPWLPLGRWMGVGRMQGEERASYSLARPLGACSSGESCVAATGGGRGGYASEICENNARQEERQPPP